MKTFKLFQWVVILAIILVAAPGAAASVPQEPGDSVESGGVESISDSWVYWFWDASIVPVPDLCFKEGASQWFCFAAQSQTTDWDYVYYLWMRFPDDWVVGDVTVSGEPYCTSGGTFGPFSWSASFTDNEVRIEHVRYHANPSDTCMAAYCVQVTSGSPSPGVSYANASWYWTSSGYGSPPYHPCSSDGYTPTGQPACDEMKNDPAHIEKCLYYYVYLPAVLKDSP